MDGWMDGIFWAFLMKVLNVKLHEKPSRVTRVVLRGQTDRQDKDNCCFSQICKSACNYAEHASRADFLQNSYGCAGAN
jgi:hypothetical protein